MKHHVIRSHVERSRRLLAGNALFTAACAVPMTLVGPDLARALLGDARWATLLTAVGIALLVYAGMLGLARRFAPLQLRRCLLAFASADALWVIGSAWMLVAAPPLLTSIGQVVVLAVASIVGVFGVRQARLGLTYQAWASP